MNCLLVLVIYVFSFIFFFFYFLFGGGKSVCSNFKVLMFEVFLFLLFLLVYSRIGGVYFAYYKFVFNHVLVLGYFTLSLFVAQLLLI